jgi:hypothetical protein
MMEKEAKLLDHIHALQSTSAERVVANNALTPFCVQGRSSHM